MAVSEACTDIMFIKMIMEFLELEVERPIKVYCDKNKFESFLKNSNYFETKTQSSQMDAILPSF